LIFPYANGNLRSYWREAKHPVTASKQHKDFQWMVKQCMGLADALHTIHEHKSKGSKRFGRHGDIKPENILWFQDQDSTDPKTTANGRLLIADFGLTRFHTEKSRSNVEPAGIAGSRTYSPPECDLSLPISRAYDIWSLGCVYLEFLTWFICGWQGILNFERGRFVEIDNRRDLKFYTIQDYKSSSDQSAILKPSVAHWISQLRCSSSNYVEEFLALVQQSILVVDTKARMSAKDIVTALSKLLERSQTIQIQAI
jgi:serine/threonine protein kinase